MQFAFPGKSSRELVQLHGRNVRGGWVKLVCQSYEYLPQWQNLRSALVNRSSC